MSARSSKTSSARYNGRRLQYSLRMLLTLMLVASAGLSWLAVSMQKARRQSEAVEAIRAIGGSVEYDDEFERSGDQPAYRQPSGPTWPRKLLGHDFFAGVFAVVLDSDQVTDADLEEVKTLNGLQWLSLHGARITDAGLEQLNGLTQLRLLDLHGTQVTDAGLKQLTGLTQLKVLDLSGTRVTDAGLEHLARLPHLGFLYIQGTGMTREGTKKLRQALPHCEVHR